MKQVFENFQISTAAGIAAMESYSKAAGNFYGGFHVSAIRHNTTKAEALEILLSWAEKAADISASIAENNVERNAQAMADAAEATSSSDKLAAWNGALAAGRAIAADMTEANAFSALASEISVAISAAKHEAATKILRVCRVCGDRSMVDRDPSDPSWATTVFCTCRNCPDDNKGWAHA